jgi:transposase
MSISVEKRELIVAAKKRGEKEDDIALWLNVSKRTVATIWELYGDAGGVLPTKPPGRPSRLTAADEERVAREVARTPDATLAELIARLSLPIQKSQMQRLLAKLGLSFKKKTVFPESQLRGGVHEKRKAWIEARKGLDPHRLVFLDESTVDCGMTRRYGRARRGEGVRDHAPDARFERTSVISAVRLDGRQAPMVFKGALDGAAFAAYVREVLAPILGEGDRAVMDNLAVHKVCGALGPIYENGAAALFLPPYSPDFNPIEPCWSKMKASLRRLKARTYGGLMAAMKTALDEVSASDIAGWFGHCGYC